MANVWRRDPSGRLTPSSLYQTGPAQSLENVGDDFFEEVIESGAWSSTAVASLTATGAPLASANWSSSTVASVTFTGDSVTVTAADWNLSAVASLTAQSETIIAADFSAATVASVTFESKAVAKKKNLDGSELIIKRPQSTDDEDIMFLVSAIHVYLEQNNGYY